MSSPPSLEPPLAPDPLSLGAEVHLRDYLYVILKWRWLVVTVTLAVFSGIMLRTLAQKPVYSASAVVQINRGKLNVIYGVVSQESWFDAQEFYPTQERILRSHTLAERVVDDLELWRHPVFRLPGETEPSAERRETLARAVLGMLSVRQIRSSQLLEVVFTTPDPQLSARLANALVDRFISFNTHNETEMARDTASFFGEQIEKLHREIQDKEELLQEYSLREDIVLNHQQDNLTLQELEALSEQLVRVQAERAAAEGRYRSLLEAKPESMEVVLHQPSVRALSERRTLLQNEYVDLLAQYGSDWPAVRRTRAALEEAEERWAREVEAASAKFVATAKTDYHSVLEREKLIKASLDQKKKEAQKANRALADFNRVKVELDSKRAMLQQLVRRQSESGMSAELDAGQMVNVLPVERALVPRAPSGPRLARAAGFALLLGLSLAVGLALFLEYWNTSIRNVEDLRRYVPLPYLGMVPRFGQKVLSLSSPSSWALALPWPGGGESAGGKGEWAVTRSCLALTGSDGEGLSRETPPVAERFKFIRGSLLMSSAGRPPKTILVTGPNEDVGKTFVACNLATSLTEQNKTVLLVDADLRNPQVHRVFGFSNERGLSSVLAGHIEREEDCVLATPIPNVFVLTAGPPSPTPSTLLESPQMEEVLRRTGKAFDFVLLDSAPLLPVYDSHVLTSRCDTSLLVVRCGHTSRSAVTNSLDLVRSVGGKMSGVILNDVDLADIGHSYYYGYRSGEYPVAAEEPAEQEV